MSYKTITAPPEQTSRLLRACLILGGIIGATGVMLMAAAAHVDTTGLVQTAAQMLLFHAPVILLIGVLTQVRHSPFLWIALLLFAAGLLLFCGDLVSRAFANRRLFPMSAPTGGTLVIAGWVALIFTALRIRAR